MFALRCENMPYYAEKIDTMLNEAYAAFTVSRLLLLARSRTSLSILLGHARWLRRISAKVIEYFKGFIDVVGFGDPSEKVDMRLCFEVRACS